jgi:hypothetical protein
MGSVMPRRPDWPEQLADAVEKARKTPFSWGSHDCALWACEVIQRMTGVDPAASVRGTYSDAAGARAALHTLGGDTLRSVAESLATAHGFPPVAIPLAQRGDLGCYEPGKPLWPVALGICVGAQAAFVGRGGIGMLPMSNIAVAWRI